MRSNFVCTLAARLFKGADAIEKGIALQPHINGAKRILCFCLQARQQHEIKFDSILLLIQAWCSKAMVATGEAILSIPNFVVSVFFCRLCVDRNAKDLLALLIRYT